MWHSPYVVLVRFMIKIQNSNFNPPTNKPSAASRSMRHNENVAGGWREGRTNSQTTRFSWGSNKINKYLIKSKSILFPLLFFLVLKSISAPAPVAFFRSMNECASFILWLGEIFPLPPNPSITHNHSADGCWLSLVDFAPCQTTSDKTKPEQRKVKCLTADLAAAAGSRQVESIKRSSKSLCNIDFPMMHEIAKTFAAFFMSFSHYLCLCLREKREQIQKSVILPFAALLILNTHTSHCRSPSTLSHCTSSIQSFW